MRLDSLRKKTGHGSKAPMPVNGRLKIHARAADAPLRRSTHLPATCWPALGSCMDFTSTRQRPGLPALADMRQAASGQQLRYRRHTA